MYSMRIDQHYIICIFTEYVSTLLDEVMKLRDEYPSYQLAKDAKAKNPKTPGTVCFLYKRRVKEEIVSQLKSRFNRP